MLLADLPFVVAHFLVLDLVAPASAAFGAALIATESTGRCLLLVLLLLERVAPPPYLLLERSMQWILLELVQRQRIRRMQMIRQLEGVVVLLVDMNAKPLLQMVLVLPFLVLVLALPSGLVQPVGSPHVLFQHRQLLQVLLHRRQRLGLFAPLHVCICLPLRSSCSTQSANLESRHLGARISLSWKLVHRFDDTPPGLGPL